jgi:HME family heavy-metal exporter
LGSSGVEAVRSQSSQGISVIYVEFGWRTEVRYARQVVSERLATVPMPPGIRPQMTPPASIMGQIRNVGIQRRQGPSGEDLMPMEQAGLVAERVPTESTAKFDLNVWRVQSRNDPENWERVPITNLVWQEPGRTASFVCEGRAQSARFRTPLEDRMDLRTTADWAVRPRLLQRPGIAEVIVIGGDRKQYQVLVDPEKLIEYRVSLQQVEAAIKSNNFDKPES